MELKKLISSNCDYSPMIKKSNRESTYLEDLDVKYSLNRKLKKKSLKKTIFKKRILNIQRNLAINHNI